MPFFEKKHPFYAKIDGLSGINVRLSCVKS
jgi:hypothetical protein